jgi:hypothetical protein
MKPKHIKQVAGNYDGRIVVLTERGEIWQQERDTPPGEPRMLWRKIEGPPSGAEPCRT